MQSYIRAPHVADETPLTGHQAAKLLARVAEEDDRLEPWKDHSNSRAQTYRVHSDGG